MRIYKIWVSATVIIIGILLSISYAGHQYAAKKIINTLPGQLSRVFPSSVRIEYTDLKADTCLVSLCLSADNLRISFPISISGDLIHLNLGKIHLKRSITGIYYVDTSNQDNDSVKQNQIDIQLNGSTNLNEASIKNLTLKQNQFEARLSGTINKARQEIYLNGESVNLAQFVTQFIPRDFQFLVNLMLKNTRQDITITTDDDWIKLLNIPIMQKKVIFNQ